MANAFDALSERLQYLTSIISARDDERAGAMESRIVQRNLNLEDFREQALEGGGDDYQKQDYAPQKNYTTRLFSYLHGEFNFNSARRLGRVARVSHLVFTPLYIERTPGGEDKFKQMGDLTAETLQWLWDHAIHAPERSEQGKNPDPSLPRAKNGSLSWLWWHIARDPIEPKQSARSKPSFRGGKDKIFEFVKELFDFSEPFITTKRSIWRMKMDLLRELKASERGAFDQTKILDEEMRDGGLTNRLTNTIEFFCKHSPPEISHFKWTRHNNRSYQTYTLTHESRIGIPDHADPFTITALHHFPSEIFDGLFGRYVQGANYLILPIEAIFDETGQILKNPAAASRKAVSRKTAKAFDSFVKDFGVHRVDRAVMETSRDFIRRCFRDLTPGEARSEFVAFKCMSGRAYVYSNMRNINRDANGTSDIPQNLFTRTVILDCGMNSFERGRLIQNLTEFAAERVLTLLWIARFRLVHHALNVIQAHLSLAVSNYHNNIPQRNSVIPDFYYDKMKNLDSSVEPERQRQLVLALEFLSSCLTMLNDVIEGGITDRAKAADAAPKTVIGKLGLIKEERIAGYLSLSDFMNRRFIPAARVIARTGERYSRLRERIREIADLTNVSLQAEQRDLHRRETHRQTWLLRIAELFGEAALGYYGSMLAAEFVEKSCEIKVPQAGVFWSPHTIACGLLDGPTSIAAIYFIGVLTVLGLWLWSAVRIVRDIREEWQKGKVVTPNLTPC